MAYELTFAKLYPEGERYTGVAEKFEAHMTALSGMSFLTPVIAKVVEWFPPEGADKLMRIRVWQDKTPFLTDLYKLEVIAHGSPVPWAAIAVALAFITGIAVISWNVSHIDWKAATPALIGLGVGLALIALAVMLGRPKRREA